MFLFWQAASDMKDKISNPCNGSIQGTMVRIIHNGASDVYPKHVALQKSRELNLDLIQVGIDAKGLAICRVADIGKFKYEMSKKQKPQTVKHEKEIRLRPTTDEHDLGIKIKHAKAFIDDGHPVIFKLKMKGREKAHREVAYNTLQRVIEAISEAKFDTIKSTENGLILKAQP